MTFASPYWLLGLLALPLLWWMARRPRERPGIVFSVADEARELPKTGWARLIGLPAILAALSLGLGILALARPQMHDAQVEQRGDGIDIVLTLDVSTSMSADDLLPNRFEAARRVAAEFIHGRKSDRIGLVVFAAKPYTQSPLTLDYSFLQEMLAEVRMGLIEDGTAIGTAIATATARLRESDAESKVIILLTDGRNNRGEIDPMTAAEAAAAFDVRIYTIGVGRRRAGPFRDLIPSAEIDEEVLERVADNTGGRYYRATDTETLRLIYDEIAELETTEIESDVTLDTRELYMRFLLPALVLLALSVLLASTRLRKVP